MKRIALLVSALFLSSAVAFAQGEIDAYRYSQSDLNGTARYMGMAGAFGALGGDISAMYTNPAGLGIYRSSEVLTTLGLSSVKAKTNWYGIEQSQTKTKFNFDNIAYVGYFPTSNDVGIVSWNVGFAYNRKKDYNRNYRMTGTPVYSLADYVSDITYGTPESDLLSRGDNYDYPYGLGQNVGKWMSVLGYQSGFIVPWTEGGDAYHSAYGKWNGDQFTPYSPDEARLRVREKGSIDEYDFSLATNISNLVFIGATFVVTDLDFHVGVDYDEDFGKGNNMDWLYLGNNLRTEGTGYAANVGVIVRPVDFLRFGVAYNSPTWYKMTDYYWGTGTSFIRGGEPVEKMTGETPSNASTNYELRTPDRWIFSAAAILGQSALLSVDYQITNYKNMRLYNDLGIELPDNDLIRSDFKMSKMLKVGAEVKVTPQFSVRAGGAWETSPMTSLFNEGLEVYTAGTIPNYAVDNGSTSYYTVGLGYRFTPNFYADLACVFKSRKEDVFAFSNTYDNGERVIESIPASLKTNTTKVALTVGYKF